MPLKMHENSLFAILLRQAWWISGLVAIAMFGLLRFVLPWEFALFAALPFVAISAYVAWKQLRAPGAERIAKTVEKLRAMSWDEFSANLESAYRREGFRVTRLGGGRADFELVQGARHTLVAGKRWKATRTGVEPLRELEAARAAHEAHECVYVSVGEVTEQAMAFALEKKIRVLRGAELALLFGA
ncbi:MAG TPA: restriction endonuclease [Burkholderiales bacterium]|nr:restriction endonuclease [Burkholderiales bacterium]